MPDKPTSLADRLFPSIDEEELTDSILSIPPEQRRLHTDTYDFSVSTLLEYLHKKSLRIPEFQRRYVWSQTQGSRLIESLVIQCPIPVIYLNQEKDETLAVIDGTQRIRSLERYARDEFPLKGLTAYPELDGLRYSQLDARFQRHIMNRTLRCIVIGKETHPQVKFDVFERLNTGAVKLTAQELRHGIYFGKLMKLSEELGRDKRWRALFPGFSDKRMRTEEFVVRFLALHDEVEGYEKPLSAFLNRYAERHRNPPEPELERYRALFDETLTRVAALYGDVAFKIFDRSGKIVSPFNAALFDAEMLSVSRAKSMPELSAKRRREFLDELATLFNEERFFKSIARATSDEALVGYRIKTLRELVDRYVQ